MKKLKKALIWLLAILITLFSAYYQRISGPTYPKKYEIVFYDSLYNFKLIRSNVSTHDAIIKLVLHPSLIANLYYKKYPTKDTFTVEKFVRTDDTLVAFLPKQPPAGKLQYYIEIFNGYKTIFTNQDKPLIIRFKGEVPNWILILHIFFMFLAMFFSTLTGFYTIANYDKQKLFSIITLTLMIIGGAILGPIVQKYAFGHYWTGIPFGWDLTDNKTLIAIILWTIAVWLNIKKQRRWIIILAAVLTLIVFLIPHSLFGSQLDYQTGKVIQGSVFHLFFKNNFF